ncbi:right-handed parallel beta-helix repeat-containing protein [candidate division KSB1 bacterium]|nr:right-handed parallel beta-helix repeat-containing protein [candidate division KSB1 bacterium]
MRSLSSGRWAFLPAALCLLVAVLPPSVALAFVRNVPADHATIVEAMAASQPEDTILVDRGLYPELIRFPEHRLTLMSHYELSGDSADIYGTVIDGNSFANQDTATLITMDTLCVDGNVVSGFTLTGGHGTRFPYFGEWKTTWGVFHVVDNSPVIKHNIMRENSCSFHLVGLFMHSSVLFRANRIEDNHFEGDLISVDNWAWSEPSRIEDNAFKPNPESESAIGPCIEIGAGTTCEIKNCMFEGLVFAGVVVLVSFGRDLVVEGCTIASCHATDPFFGALFMIDEDDVTLRDNVFRDNLVYGTGSILCSDGRNLFNLIVEGNTFENMTVLGGEHGWVGEGCFHTQFYRGRFENNIFRNCKGPSSGVGAFVQNSNPLVFEHNLIEACSTTYGFDTPCGGILRYNSENIVGHYNIFRNNFPGAVGSNNPHPAQPMDFTMNYWGDPSGPYEPDSNSAGLGDRIGSDVLFRPWAEDTVFAVGRSRPPAWIPSSTSVSVYPNPFNNSATLTVQVGLPGEYAITLTSVTGQRVRNAWKGTVVTSRDVRIDLADAASGVYFATVQAGLDNRPLATAKLVLMK